MKTKNILLKIKKIDKNFFNFIKKLKNQDIVKNKTTYYTQKEKKEFLDFWEEFIKFTKDFQDFIDSIKYKKFFIIFSYDNFVVKRYLIFKYIKFLIEIKKLFWKNKNILINFLYKECRVDYLQLVRNIYKYEYLKIINPWDIFIKNLKSKISKKYYFMLNAQEILSEKEKKYFFSERNIFFILFHLRPKLKKVKI